MEFIKLENSDSQEFKKAWKIYKLSFPSDERRNLGNQIKVLRNENYNMYSIKDNKIIIGLFCVWNFKDFLFGEHFAIKKELRNKGLGKKALLEFLSKMSYKLFIGEVERPKTDIAKRRIKFYERLGFKLNYFNYIQPPYGKDKNPVPMFLMTYPKKITKSEFSQIREKLHLVVYGLEKSLLDGQIN